MMCQYCVSVATVSVYRRVTTSCCFVSDMFCCLFPSDYY